MVALLAGATLIAATGCTMTRLRPQLQELGRFTQLGGRISGTAVGERCVAVLVDDSGPATRLVNYAFATETGTFVIIGRTGKLRVLAFADRDRDAVLDDDEPIAWATVPASPPGGVAARLEVGELRLSADSERPAFAVDLATTGAPGAQARARRLGEVVTLDDPRFADEIIQRGVWEPLRFAQESGLQLLFTEPYDPARTPVVFVHGMLGSPRDFRDLVAGLDRTRFQAWLYYYPTGFDLPVSGLVLREMLAELRQRLAFQRLHVVAHSMGGLVSYSALTGAARDGIDLGVERYVTISTPWLGALGSRGMKTGLSISKNVAPSWVEMLPESTFLEALAAQPVPSGIHFSMLFGYLGSNAMVVGADDGSVALRSTAAWSMVERAEYVLPIAADHVGILSDPAATAAVYRLLRGEPPTPGTARR